jgi:hypothetical protein
MLVFGSALAQSAAPTVGTPGQRVQVQQTLFVDESGRLDFESARTQDFKPFNPLERLAIGDKVEPASSSREAFHCTTGCMAADQGGDRPVSGREPGGKGGHARDAHGVQDQHLCNLHHRNHSLLRQDPVQDWGRPPSHQSCWALVTKLLRTILKEVHKVWRFAAEAVLIGSDFLMTNGMVYLATGHIPQATGILVEH